jgi:integration host factor subunit beta
MTKSELVDRLCRASQSGTLSLVRAESVVNAIFDSIESALEKGERTEIRGFGSFEVRTYGEYTGRNPRSGSSVTVKAKRLPFFKAGKELKDRINEAAQLKFAQRRGPLSAPHPAATPTNAPTVAPSAAAASAPILPAGKSVPAPMTAIRTETRTESVASDDFASRVALGR